MKSKKNSKSGYLLVLAIVLLLAVPPIVGHFAMHGVDAALTYANTDKK